MCADTSSSSRTGRAVVGRTAAARAAVVRRACVAVGRAVIIVVVVNIIVRESADPSTIAFEIVSARVPRSCRAIDVDRAIDRWW